MKVFKVLITLLALAILNSCSSNEDDKDQSSESSLLIGKWYRISTEDQDGNITDDTFPCNITEYTENEYIVTDYTDSDCTQEFSSGSLPYKKVDNLMYFGEINQDIKVASPDTKLSSFNNNIPHKFENAKIFGFGEASHHGKEFFDSWTRK